MEMFREDFLLVLKHQGVPFEESCEIEKTFAKSLVGKIAEYKEKYKGNARLQELFQSYELTTEKRFKLHTLADLVCNLKPQYLSLIEMSDLSIIDGICLKNKFSEIGVPLTENEIHNFKRGHQNILIYNEEDIEIYCSKEREENFHSLFNSDKKLNKLFVKGKIKIFTKDLTPLELEDPNKRIYYIASTCVINGICEKHIGGDKKEIDFEKVEHMKQIFGDILIEEPGKIEIFCSISKREKYVEILNSQPLTKKLYSAGKIEIFTK